MPPWLEEAVDSSEEESRRFPHNRNVKKGGGKCLFTSRHFGRYFSDFSYGETDGYVSRQSSETKKMYTTEQTLMVGIIMIVFRDGKHALWDEMSQMD
jgi:hypothetical protein